MRRQSRRRAGQGALLALLLPLVLPLLTVHQATAAPGPAGPFVICTAAGLVWIDPGADASDSEPAEGEPEPAHHCPVCFAKQLATAALLPATPLHHPLPLQQATSVPAVPVLQPNGGSAPPLPPRGPPLAA